MTFRRPSTASPTATAAATTVLYALLVTMTPLNARSQPAAEPSSSMSVAEMVRALIGRDPRYSFTPTAPPEPGTGLCAGQAVKGAPRLSVEPGPATKPTAPVAEAVPYNPGAGASLQLSPQFELGSDRINAASNQLLQNMATALKDPALAGGRFAIAGHADVSGNEPMNQRLSCARAIAVRDFLLSNGLAASQITAYGFGSSQLLPGHAPTSPIHRRVEIRRAR